MRRFCFDCQHILRTVDQLFDGDDVPVSSPFTSGFGGWIAAATERKCDLCFITYFDPEPDMMRRTHGEMTDEDEMIWQLLWRSEDWIMLLLRSTNKVLAVDVYFQCQSMKDEQVLQLKSLGGEAGSSTWGPRAVKAINSWLAECISSHDECRGLSNSALPVRLVDVSPAGTWPNVPTTVEDINSLSVDALPQVKLCPTTDLPSDTQYLTLSHCWGTSVSMKLSNNLLSTYANQTPLAALLSPGTKVFRDAIWITRCLGYNYLWIDALCINQEDEIEKSIEISRMDQIFSGAEANLSATSASSGADGMIFNRKHNLYELIPCDWKKPVLEKIQDGTIQEKKDYLVMRVPREHINREPVNKRAWVFQERMLAPRVIHFCKNTIYRECTREYIPQLQDYSPWIIAQKRGGDSHMKHARYEPMEEIDDIQMGKRDWCHRFRGFVERFSPALLTFPEDRLASLAGIAKNISLEAGLEENEYFAGLWELDLPMALLWRAENGVGAKKWDPENIGYIAPSWSWAGCEAPELRCGEEYKDNWENLVTVINVWTVPKIPDGSRFGALSDGAMILKGRLVEMHRKRIGDAFLVSIRDGDSHFESELYFETRGPRSHAEYESYCPGRFKEFHIFWGRFTKTSERRALTILQMDASIDVSSWISIEPEILYLLPIGQDSASELYRIEEYFILEGLVLCRDDTTGSFRRVGTFDTWTPYPTEFNQELRLRLLKIPETELTIV